MTRSPNRPPQVTQLPPCPDTPNCVCTFDSDEQHGSEAIDLPPDQTPDAVLDRVAEIVREMGGEVVRRDDRYLHAEFTTRILRFIDDVEFLVDARSGRLHFRSASRVGRSDLGVNRRRMDRFRAQFEANRA